MKRPPGRTVTNQLHNLLDIPGFFAGLLCALVLRVLDAVVANIASHYSARYLLAVQARIATVALTWIVASALLLRFAPVGWSGGAVLGLGIAALWVINAPIISFWRVGLARADRNVRSGLNYERSLLLCKNHLDFLGTGASKLTSLPGFEAAMKRCNHPDRPIRFLLSRPDNPLLRKAATTKGETADSYQNRVRTSLQRLARLAEQGLNISVRFHPSEREGDLPVFRLMFINQTICLASYNAYGEGDGSAQPQLHVVRSSRDRDQSSFYYAFHRHFEQSWDDSTPWDPNDFR